jgi:hypothetical protein
MIMIKNSKGTYLTDSSNTLPSSLFPLPSILHHPSSIKHHTSSFPLPSSLSRFDGISKKVDELFGK